MDPAQQLEVAKCIFREANDAFLIFDPRTHRLVDINPAAQRLTGRSKKDLLGVELQEVLEAEGHRSVDELIHAYEVTSIFHALEGYFLVTGKGERLPISVSASRIHTSPEPLGLVVVRDVSERVRAETERRELESQIHQDQRLESLGLMAGGVAHDFNNLLTGIMAYSELALGKVGDQEPLREYLTMVRSSVRRASDLTRQMLAFAGKANLVFEAVDLRLIAEELCELARASLSRKVDLQLDVPAGLPCVEGDATQLQQVLLNLISNAGDAIGAMEERGGAGTIQLRVETIQIASRKEAPAAVGEPLRPGDYLRIQVVDDGCGMSGDVRAKIFEPFYTTKFTGRGLGMASVLGIVRGHHGAIAIDSAPGQGTTTSVYVPALNDYGELSVEPEEVLVNGTETGRVLVIDDEETVRKAVAEILSQAGYEVVLAEDGKRGLARYREEAGEFDVVLLDVTMPDMDGGEVLKSLRASGDRVPVVLCSGYAINQTAAELIKNEATGFLQKPFSSVGLVDALRTATAAPGGV